MNNIITRFVLSIAFCLTTITLHSFDFNVGDYCNAAAHKNAGYLQINNNEYNVWIRGKKPINISANHMQAVGLGSSLVGGYMVYKGLQKYAQPRGSYLKKILAVPALVATGSILTLSGIGLAAKNQKITSALFQQGTSLLSHAIEMKKQYIG